MPLPDSLTVKGKGASRSPEACLMMRKAWCGRFGLEPSLVVKDTLMLSWCPRLMAVLTRSALENLPFTKFSLWAPQWSWRGSLLLDHVAGRLGGHGDGCIRERPRRCGSGCAGEGQQRRGCREAHFGPRREGDCGRDEDSFGSFARLSRWLRYVVALGGGGADWWPVHTVRTSQLHWPAFP